MPARAQPRSRQLIGHVTSGHRSVSSAVGVSGARVVCSVHCGVPVSGESVTGLDHEVRPQPAGADVEPFIFLVRDVVGQAPSVTLLANGNCRHDQIRIDVKEVRRVRQAGAQLAPVVPSARGARCFQYRLVHWPSELRILPMRNNPMERSTRSSTSRARRLRRHGVVKERRPRVANIMAYGRNEGPQRHRESNGVSDE